MSISLPRARAVAIVVALCSIVAVAPAEAAHQGGAHAAGRQRAQRSVASGSLRAKRMRTRQPRSLRPVKRKPVKRVLVRRPARRMIRQLPVLSGLFGAATPAEQLMTELAASFVKHGLRLREHNPFTNEVQTVALSQVDEIALGAAMIEQIVPTLGVPLSGRPMERYLDAIVHRLVTANGLDRLTPYRFKVHLVVSDTVNAFAAPGGRIVVTTALLRGMKSEASIAGILAHEIGHVVARHGSQNLARSALIQDLLTSLGRAAGTDLNAQMAVLQGAQELKQVMLSFSRDQEHQSDSLGVRLLAGAGYSARGVEEMAEFLGSIDGALAFDDSGSDHPNPIARRQNLYATARERGMSYAGEHGAERFALNVTLPLAFGIF